MVRFLESLRLTKFLNLLIIDFGTSLGILLWKYTHLAVNFFLTFYDATPQGSLVSVAGVKFC